MIGTSSGLITRVCQGVFFKHALPLHDSHLFGGRRDDVRDILACRDLLERPLNQAPAIGAKFRNFDERVFLLELRSDGSKPGMGIGERETGLR